MINRFSLGTEERGNVNSLLAFKAVQTRENLQCFPPGEPPNFQRSITNTKYNINTTESYQNHTPHGTTLPHSSSHTPTNTPTILNQTTKPKMTSQLKIINFARQDLYSTILPNEKEPMSTTQATPSMDDASCPHCSRSFNPLILQEHIHKCTSIPSQRDKIFKQTTLKSYVDE
jgi:hypothetical protein